MNRRSNGQTLTRLSLLCSAICVSGCNSAGQRNLTESIVVTALPSLTDHDVKFALELRNRREEFVLAEADAFLASDRGAKLSHRLRSQLESRRRKLDQTIAEVRPQLSSGFALVRPNREKPYADDNIVVYLGDEKAIHVFFSYGEISELLSYKEMADDLATIRYKHPCFDADQLVSLRNRLAELSLEVESVSIGAQEREQLKTAAATRVLERSLRESGVGLPIGPPLLTSGSFAQPRSPKLTQVLRDRAVFEQIVRSSNPDVVRALVYLVDHEVIRLVHP